MKKFAVIIAILGVFAVNGYSQEFLNNPDYIYGVGDTEEEAFVSLSRSIITSVTSKVNYYIIEKGKKVEEEYEKLASVVSDVDLGCVSLPYYDKFTKQYYRYINKTEYLNEHLANYQEFMERAEELENTKVRHELNLILGYYYLAYRELDDPLMRAFYGRRADDEKEHIKRMAEKLYCSSDYGFIASSKPDFYPVYATVSGVYDNDNQPASLFGFEYYYDGCWKSPVKFKEDVMSDDWVTDDGYSCYKKCIITDKITCPLYRILYEYCDNGRYVKINVPDEWYFRTVKMLR